VTSRNEIPEPHHPSRKRRIAALCRWDSLFASPLIKLFGKLESLKLRLFAGSAPKTIENSIKALEDQDYVGKSYKVLDLGAPNYVDGYRANLLCYR
jgi:hypothetical protein